MHNGGVASVCFSRDGKYFLSGSRDSTIKLGDVSTGEVLETFYGHKSWVNSICFSPDGNYILSGGGDSVIKLWDVTTGTEIRTFTKHNHRIRAVSFSPDGKYAISGSLDSTVRLWDISTGNEIKQFLGVKAQVYSTCFSPDGKYVLAGYANKSFILSDISTGKVIKKFSGHTAKILCAKFSLNGKNIISGGDNNNSEVWDNNSGKKIKNLTGHKLSINSVCVLPDSRFALSVSFDSTIKLWNIDSSKAIFTFSGHKASVNAVDYSDKNKLIISASSDSTLKLWDIKSGKEVQSLKGHNSVIFCVSFSPDGKYAASGGADSLLYLWDLTTGEISKTFKGHSGGVYSLCFSPDGKSLISGSADKTLILWNIQSGKTIKTFKGHSERIENICISNEGDRIISCGWDKTIKLWDISSDTAVNTFSGHKDWITGVDFSPDLKFILSGSRDNTLKIWNAQSGKELASLISIDSTDWAIVTPEGLFDASDGGMKLMHFVVNTPDGPEIIELEQLRKQYWIPNLLPKLLGLKKGNLPDYKEQFKEIELYPKAILTNPITDGKLKIKLQNRGGGFGRVVIKINGKEINADPKGGMVLDQNSEMVELPEFDINNQDLIIPGDTNIIEIITYNQDGYLNSRGEPLEFTSGEESEKDADIILWAVIAGVSEYEGEGMRLDYASKDAEDFANAIQMGADNLFRKENVHISLLNTSGKPGILPPTKNNLFEAFSTLKQAKPQDIILVYLSGHGMSKNDSFYYFTKEARNTDLILPGVISTTTISGGELKVFLQVPVKKQIIILDVCHSGAFGELLASKDHGEDIENNRKTLYDLKERAGVYILAGCAKDKYSFESPKLSNGLLTYSLLKGLKGEALEPNGRINIQKLCEYTFINVETYAKQENKSQIPVFTIPSQSQVFWIGKLDETDFPKINITENKTVICRSKFLQTNSYDVMGLTVIVNKELFNKSISDDSEINYSEKDDLSEAYSIQGNYSTEGEEIKVKVWLTKDAKEQGYFEIGGNKGKLKELAKSIILETMKIIKGKN